MHRPVPWNGAHQTTAAGLDMKCSISDFEWQLPPSQFERVSGGSWPVAALHKGPFFLSIWPLMGVFKDSALSRARCWDSQPTFRNSSRSTRRRMVSNGSFFLLRCSRSAVLMRL
jgi:hypothetical protein